jgi:arylsulfatase A-like enzyme
VILLDSLNRHMLGAYGGREFATPNLDRLAARSVRFTRHFTGSLPCMPARHDILCGALDFLWKPWGSIELWEDAITRQLHDAGVATQLISDHPHLFEVGGENYHVDFTAWDYVRGGESDPGAPGRTRAGSDRRSSSSGRWPTTTRAAGSAARPIFPARAPCRRPPAGWTTTPAATTASSCSSTSSIRTSRSTRRSPTCPCTTPTGRSRT